MEQKYGACDAATPDAIGAPQAQIGDLGIFKPSNIDMHVAPYIMGMQQTRTTDQHAICILLNEKMLFQPGS